MLTLQSSRICLMDAKMLRIKTLDDRGEEGQLKLGWRKCSPQNRRLIPSIRLARQRRRRCRRSLRGRCPCGFLAHLLATANIRLNTETPVARGLDTGRRRYVSSPSSGRCCRRLKKKTEKLQIVVGVPCWKESRKEKKKSSKGGRCTYPNRV